MARNLATILGFAALLSITSARRQRASDALEIEEELEGSRDDAWCLQQKLHTISCSAGEVLKATKAVVQHCDGRASCDIPAEFHSTCPGNPYTHMRVLYACVAGTPKLDDKPAEIKEVPHVEIDLGGKEVPKNPEGVPVVTVKKDIESCLSETLAFGCPQGSSMSVRSAFYNRMSKEGCTPKAESPWTVCSANATAAIVAHCAEKGTPSSCVIQSTDHSACPDNPFIQMRVNYMCTTP